MRPIDGILDRLAARDSRVKAAGPGRFEAQCPAHDDRTASLSVAEGDEYRVLLHCHAGCTHDDVCSALGIELHELFAVSSNGRASGLATSPRRSLAARSSRFSIDTAHVDRCHEALLTNAGALRRLAELRSWSLTAIERLNIGLDGTRITIPIRDREAKLVGLGLYQPNPDMRGDGQSKMLAAPGTVRELWPAPETIDVGESIWITEGEPDAISLWSVGIPAVAIPGAGKRDLSWAARFAGRRVVLCLDADTQGREAAAWLADQLVPVAAEVRLLNLDPTREDGWDVGALIREATGSGMSGAGVRTMLLRMADGVKPAARPAPVVSELGGGDSEWPPLVAWDRPPFPVEALPSALREWVLAVAEDTQTPTDLAALAAIGVLSAAAMGPEIDCGGWVEPSVALYLLVAMGSGERKSSVLREAKRPLVHLQAELRKATEPAFLADRARRKVLAERIGKLTTAASKSGRAEADDDAERELIDAQREHDEIGEPARRRLFADDATPEALAGLLAAHGKMAVLSAESAFLDNLLGRHDKSGSANLHLVCGAYTADPTIVDRRSRDSEEFDRPLLSICLAPQPHVLATLVTHATARSQGLVGRFAYAVPESNAGHRNVDAARIPARASEAWAQTVRHVWSAVSADTADRDRAFGVRDGTSVSSVSTPVVLQLHLSGAAYQLLRQLRIEIEPRLAEHSGDLFAISDWVARHHGRIARVAALLHLTEHTIAEPIGEATMRAALRVGAYWLAHAQAALIGPADPQVGRAFAWLRRGGVATVTQRDLLRAPPLNGRATADDAAKLAATLVRFGVVRAEPTPAGSSPSYQVHPDLVSGVTR